MMHNLAAIQQQCIEDSAAWFGNVAYDIVHHTLSALGELGEFANILKKIDRGDAEFNNETAERLAEELVDTFIYICNMGALLNLDIAAAYHAKREVNGERFGKDEDSN